MQTAIVRAIKTMWNCYDEPLTLAEMADAAIFSRFYFSRIFRTATGTSPGRFLAAIRLYTAKRLLLSTSVSVTDLSYRVGFNSVGTFITRFNKSVGVSPAKYRDMSQADIPSVSAVTTRHKGRLGTVSGRLILPPTTTPTRIYVGIFGGSIVEGTPTSCDIADDAGRFCLTAVPDREWFIRAAAVGVREPDERPSLRTPLFVGAGHVDRVRQGEHVRLGIRMRPTSIIDPPILLALPELDGVFVPEQVAAR
jgi:AraC-like DNA-binding protein